MNILREELKGLPGGLRPAMEAKINTSIRRMIQALDGLEKTSDSLSLTLLTEVANIKAVINLAQNLHQPQVADKKQDPDE